MSNQQEDLKLRNVYLAHLGRREGQRIWIVDGALVARDIYPEFIFGGNDMRYCFNPPGDVWIDNRIGVEELVTTLKHELVERRLMKDDGLTYDDAHNEALKLELTLRPNWEKRCVNEGMKLIQYAEKFLVKPLLAVPQEKLTRLYRQPYGRYRGATIWIVDGTIVRQHLDPDYGSVDSLYMNRFVPPNQFWVDSSVCSLEAYFSLFKRKALHRLRLTGLSIERCTEQALELEVAERKRQCSYAARHELLLDPVSYGARERGPMHQ
ncbi:MAG: hypothetical protein K2X93_28775 [Candidatus Obscuribacterales bacterium]|nr:hypothetical protein [Candidatus Obscuribacterales bacterium]